MPVKLMWTREEDMRHGRYHPVTQCKLARGLDAQARSRRCTCASPASRSWLASFPQRLQQGRDPVVFQGLNASGTGGAIGYTFPNLLIDHAMRNPPCRRASGAA